ncbi:MAG: F0F1 ATP synthase subunit delta [Saezia sp.]
MAELATIARPYAEAVYQVAQDDGEQDQWIRTLEVLSVVASSPEFRQLPLNPKMTAIQLVDILSSFVDEKGSVSIAHLKRFLLQLVEHRRTQALPEILKQFQQMCDAAKDVAQVMIYTAYPLSEKGLKDILPTLEKRFGLKLKPQVLIDESLIGGICAVVGDDTLDLSVKARLEQMKQALTA